MDMDMFKSVFDPFNENRDLKCEICNMYLSIAPIIFHESVGKMCGRCFERGETKKYPNLAFETQMVYETIAKYIIYPCSFQAKGCSAKLRWDQVRNHEDSCHFQDNKCPFGQDAIIFDDLKCEWRGDNQNLFLHLKETHGGYFSDLLKMILIVPDPKGNILISNFMDIPVVAILFVTEDLKQVIINLMMDSTVQSVAHCYDLEVSDDIGKHKMVFLENKITPLCERAFTVYSLKHGFNLNIGGLQALLRSNSLYFWFKIKSKQSYLLQEESNLSLNQHLIFNQKCEVCENMLIDLIYVCSHGHNICSYCYDHISYCICKMKITCGRNKVLENLSKISLYECKNKDQGCRKLIKPGELKLHEQTCKLTLRSCVMECEWSGNNAQMLHHLRVAHTKLNLNEDNLYYSTQRKKKFFTILDENIFVISISFDENFKSLSVKVECLGADADRFRFKFSITSGKLELTCCHYCHPFLDDESDEQYPAIMYPFEMLKQFLLEKTKFNFRVNIFS